jgi:hypothetical protein
MFSYDFSFKPTDMWRYASGAKKQYGNSYYLNPKQYVQGKDGAIRLRNPNPLKGKAMIKAAKRATHAKGFYRKQREAITNG